MHTNEIVFQQNRVVSYIGWKPPKLQFVKLNVDGASNNGKRAGCGGGIRGNQGEWLGGFAKSVGDCNATIAELWGVLEGIHTGRVNGAIGYSLIKRIRSMLDMAWNIEIMHEYREANTCADALARIGCSLEHDMIFYDDCPATIREVMLADELGMTTPRMIVA
ncbi:hypothetical protein TSUD_216930 [Trifolium subterraneum]|uniref:Uncharacterized protein n=1 Tax=Trifolium subterraneum TaxID=3900 RepID=A0A2Z6MP29_TRISU|nr:hypothetical protein TSUD_216930 [Trifolium subterraneum]